MYKETLPTGCPSEKAKEDDKVLYRLFVHEKNTLENYFPYTVLYPEIEKYRTWCDAYSISLFDSKERAIEYALRNPRLGNYIAQIAVKKIHGKLRLTNKKTGHYSLWLYNAFDPVSLECKIEVINV